MRIFGVILALILGVYVLAGEIPHTPRAFQCRFCVLWWLDSLDKKKVLICGMILYT